MKIGIFYGSTTGVTEAVAERIAKKLGVASADVHNVGSATAADAVSTTRCCSAPPHGAPASYKTTGTTFSTS